MADFSYVFGILIFFVLVSLLTIGCAQLQQRK